MDPVIVPHIITALLALGMAIAFLAADRRLPTSRALALFLGTVGIAIAIGALVAPQVYARHGVPAWGGVFAVPGPRPSSSPTNGCCGCGAPCRRAT